MAEVRWTTQAAEDLEAIAQFIAADSPQYTRLFVIDVLETVDRTSVQNLAEWFQKPIIR